MALHDVASHDVAGVICLALAVGADVAGGGGGGVVGHRAGVAAGGTRGRRGAGGLLAGAYTRPFFGSI
jgi:hypothetical protein